MKTPPSLKLEAWLNEPALRRVFAAIEAEGGEARVAGGAVRNALMGEPVGEVDIATTLTPERVISAGMNARLGVHPTGIDHGTVTLTVGGKPFEVTTLRVDVETFGRKARVSFTDDWEADAKRRDFTMNALYCSPDGKIYDYTDSYQDILRKRVKFVGSPEERIKEDNLRILRFFRFHARYGEGPVDRPGLAACRKHASKLKKLSSERIRQELFKLLVAKRASETLKLMAQNGVLRALFPYKSGFNDLSRMAKIDGERKLVPDPLLRLVLIAKDASSLRDRLRLTNVEMRRLEAIGGHIQPDPALRDRERRVVLYHLGPQAWRDTIRIAWAQAKYPKAREAWRELFGLVDEWSIPRFPVTGQDLLSRGYEPGPALGEELARLEDWWIASNFTADKESLLRKLELGKSE